MNAADRAALGVMRAFGRTGSLHVVFPDGSQHRIGTGTPEAAITVVDRAVYGATVREGSLGFLEAYVDGQISTPDLRALLTWAAANHARASSSPLGRAAAPVRALWQRLAPDRSHRKVETMTDHYNLGNDFYEAWLDASMTYSSARFAGPNVDLVDAQVNKYAAIAAHAGLRQGMRVLEIGCGWGGFAAYAARAHGVEVVGLTIADEQARYARKRLADLGLSDAVEIRLEDFRDTTGEFDAVVSIEMIESVDETVWGPLFAAFHDRVRPGGRVVMQAIVIEDDRFEGYRTRQDFIQRYIFPGGQLPSPEVIAGLARTNDLAVEAVEMFGLDYARTLRAWFDRFESAWPQLSSRGFDERFRRIWQLYLTYCEAGFRAGTIDVGQWVMSRPSA
jgi:cyclopropane-fatty-acyl-phospholipid synthase